MTEPEDEPYKVGRNRPPIEHRWKPGQSGNPLGRPVQKLSQRLQRLADRPAAEVPTAARAAQRLGLDASTLTVGEAISLALIDKALEGDVQAARTILDRVDGPVATRLDLGLDALHGEARALLAAAYAEALPAEPEE